MTSTANEFNRGHLNELAAFDAKSSDENIFLGLPIQPYYYQNQGNDLISKPMLEKPDKFDTISKIVPFKNDQLGAVSEDIQGSFCNLNCFAADAKSIFKYRSSRNSKYICKRNIRKIYEKLSRTNPELQSLISNKNSEFQRQIQHNMEMLHERVKHNSEIEEYKIIGFTYYSKILLKEIEELLQSSMP